MKKINKKWLHKKNHFKLPRLSFPTVGVFPFKKGFKMLLEFIGRLLLILLGFTSVMLIMFFEGQMISNSPQGLFTLDRFYDSFCITLSIICGGASVFFFVTAIPKS